MNQIFFSNIAKDTILFGQFKLLKCLSASNYGGVYLCAVVGVEAELVVLKVLSTHAAKNSVTEVAFRREMDLACRVHHPNVMHAKRFFQDEDFTAFTMDYIGGGTLADRMSQTPALDTESSLDILMQIGSGLQAIHNRGIIHRDLKPENVLWDQTNKVKIVDFGISVGEDSLDARASDHLVGTMDYLSPEYIACGRFDHRSDIYALGVIAYQLIAGRRPFQDGSILDSLTQRVKSDPTPIIYLRPEIPLKLNELVMKAMARQVEKRYQHLAEFLKDLSLIRVYSDSLRYKFEESFFRQQITTKSGRSSMLN